MKISVIVPVFNSSSYINRLLQSLFNQTIGFNNIELILADNGSSDNSLELIKNYQSKYPNNIVVIQVDNSRRMGGCQNESIKIAKGDYLVFSDADDFFELDALQALYDEITQKDVDVVVANTNRAFLNEKGDVYRTKNMNRTNTKFDNSLEILTNIITLWGKIYKKSLFIDNKIEILESNLFHDNATSHRLAILNPKVSMLGNVVYNWVVRSDSISHVKPSYQKLSDVVNTAEQSYFALKKIENNLTQKNKFNFVLRVTRTLKTYEELFINDEELFCKIKSVFKQWENWSNYYKITNLKERRTLSRYKNLIKYDFKKYKYKSKLTNLTFGLF